MTKSQVDARETGVRVLQRVATLVSFAVKRRADESTIEKPQVEKIDGDECDLSRLGGLHESEPGLKGWAGWRAGWLAG